MDLTAYLMALYASGQQPPRYPVPALDVHAVWWCENGRGYENLGDIDAPVTGFTLLNCTDSVAVAVADWGWYVCSSCATEKRDK